MTGYNKKNRNRRMIPDNSARWKGQSWPGFFTSFCETTPASLHTSLFHETGGVGWDFLVYNI